MKKRENKNKIERKILALATFSLIFIFSNLMMIQAADVSTSVYSAQYFPPSVTGQFSSLMNGPVSTTSGALGQQDNGFFDMQLFIPPFGCQPYVVRSDLLEEQDVPVFCQLMPLKINPGVDITRIDSLSVVQKTQSPYISGVGFHPANAAIKSGSNLASTPTGGNIGYVVVVLKRQEVERNMPDNVTVVLGAQLQYGATNTFGIQKNEFYLPVLTDEEFADSQQDYSFYEGAGYMRAESVDATSARISVYGYDNRVIFSRTIQKGQTSQDFYLPNNYGGQGIRITLKDITLPQTKARFNVNGQKLDVYVGQDFYDGKCRLTNVQSTGLGSGKATAVCNGVTFSNLEKKIVPINLETPTAGVFDLGNFVKTDNAGYDYYLVSANRAKNAADSYVVIAQIAPEIKTNFETNKAKNLNEITNSLSNLLSGKSITDVQASLKDGMKITTMGNTKIPLIVISENQKDVTSQITFAGTQTNNGPIADQNVKSIYSDAINFYDKVKGDFAGETYPLDSHNPQHSYAEEALWNEYSLAAKLGQQSDANQILSRILNEYPNSVDSTTGRTASSLINSKGMLADNPEARKYDAKNDLSIELLSVSEPSAADYSVDFSYSSGTETGSKSQVTPGGTVYSDGTQTVTLKDFDSTTVNLDCSYKDATGNNFVKATTQSAKINQPAVFSQGGCNARIFVNAINFKRIAQVTITPITNGRSRESNFTFSIGIEKRPNILNLTPAEANAKLAELDAQIAKFQNISEKLGKLIEGGKAACLATTAIINVKNLFSGTGGEASARTEVMKKWNDICSRADYLQSHNPQYLNSEECIAGEYDTKIKPEIEATTAAMKAYDDAEKKATADFKDSKLNPEQKQVEMKKQILADLSTKLTGTVTGDCKIDPKTGATIPSTCTTLDASHVLTANNLNNIPPYELSALYVNIQMMNSPNIDAASKKEYQDAVYNSLKTISDRVDTQDKQAALSQQLGGAPISYSESATRDVRTWQNLYWNQNFRNQYNFHSDLSAVQIPDNSRIAIVPSTNQASKDTYLVVLEGSGKTLNVKSGGIYKIIQLQDGSGVTSLPTDEKNVPQNLAFNVVDPTDYQNLCSNCDFMKVFSLDPFKGQPALLPFDYQNGFYVQVKNDFPGLGTGNVPSYQDSGKVNTFYLCNVGKNKLMEGYNVNDDTCRRFDFHTGDMLDAYPGLTKDQTKKKLMDALSALNDAQKQLTANPSATTIKINGRNLKVKNSEGDTGSKCTDFMSPSDCQIIYNVCDPFVCPTSRCDFGGKYPVDNVISSGIVGSTLLCLPNFILLQGNKDTGVVVPVCITGINAGLNSWIGILKSYRSCINESVTTGKTVGVCDEIYSVYLCDMFWRQAGPLASALTKNLFTTLMGAGDHGGGEYLFVQDAWNNAAKSVANFENSYAKDSNLRFGFQDLASTVVADVCKLPVSATYPDKFKTMLEPELPVQFSAWFEELSYTSATVPPTSQYNVFYEIYGGDQGHYYQVYLKSPPTSIGYIGKDSVVVASGYVDKGQTATETKNFIDTSGFKQLCVRIDAQDKCGFKSVSTSAALNYAKDKIVQDQATQHVTTESECIAGGHSLGSFLTPNIQQGAEEFINPELYNQGIIRVCSNNKPGQSTEPSRWSDVGYCDDRNVRCWLDGKSVAKAIQNKGIQNQTLAEIDSISQQNLQADGYYADDYHVKNIITVYNSIVDSIEVPADISTATYTGSAIPDYNGNTYVGRPFSSLKTDVQQLDKRLIFSKDRAELWFAEAQINDALAVKLGSKSNSPPVDTCEEAGGTCKTACLSSETENTGVKPCADISQKCCVSGGGTVNGGTPTGNGDQQQWINYLKSIPDVSGVNVYTIAMIESNVRQFNADGTTPLSSRADAYGIMQLTSIATAQVKYSFADIKTDPNKNMQAGVAYLKYLEIQVNSNSYLSAASSSDKELAIVASYNAGPTALRDAVLKSKSGKYEDYKNNLPSETQNYVIKYQNAKSGTGTAVPSGASAAAETNTAASVAAPIPPEFTDKTSIVGFVCSMLGMSGLITSSSTNYMATVNAAQNVIVKEGTPITVVAESTLSMVGKTTINGIVTQKLGLDNIITTQAGEVVGQVTGAGGARMVTKEMLTQMGKTTSYKVGGQVMKGTLTQGTELIAKTGGSVIGKFGVDATVGSSGRILKFIPATNVAFKVVSRAGVVLTIASTACDLGALGYVIYDAEKAGQALSESARNADAQMANLISALGSKIDATNVDLNMVVEDYSDLDETDQNAIGIGPNVQDMQTRMAKVIDIYDNILLPNYKTYTTNSEKQSVGLFGTGSQLSDAEYNNLMTTVRLLRSQLVDISDGSMNSYNQIESYVQSQNP